MTTEENLMNNIICRICFKGKNTNEMVINHTTPVKIHYKDICKSCATEKGRVVSNLKKINQIPENHECPICKKKSKKYYLDHDWKTGQFRGYLCNACNIALGLLKDDILILNSAIDYLNTQKQSLTYK